MVAAVAAIDEGRKDDSAMSTYSYLIGLAIPAIAELPSANQRTV